MYFIERMQNLKRNFVMIWHMVFYDYETNKILIYKFHNRENPFL